MKKKRNFSAAKKKFSICMLLQQVYCTERSFETWVAEWGYMAFFSGIASNKAGVAILLNKNFTFKVLRQICDKEGRCIIIDLEVGELILTICNVYAPNKDDPIFFQSVHEQMIMFSRARKQPRPLVRDKYIYP